MDDKQQVGRPKSKEPMKPHTFWMRPSQHDKVKQDAAAANKSKNAYAREKLGVE